MRKFWLILLLLLPLTLAAQPDAPEAAQAESLDMNAYLFGHVGDACGQAVVVGFAVDVGLVELDAIGPLLFGLVYPAREVMRPVGGGCSADDKPYM